MTDPCSKCCLSVFFQFNLPLVVPFWDHSWLHDGQNDRLLILVTRWSKPPNRNFRPWRGQNRWNFQEGYFRDHWRHVPKRNSFSRAKIWKFDPFRHTSKCDRRFWSHDGQKDRIEIFSCGAAKMGEISRKDTFETTGVMFRSEILSPGQKWNILDPCLQVSEENTLFNGRFWKLDPFDLPLVKKTEPKFSANGRPKFVNITGGKVSGPLPSSSRAKYSLQWRFWKFDTPGCTLVKKAEPKFSGNGQPKCVNITRGKHSWQFPLSYGEKYSLEVDDFGKLTHMVAPWSKKPNQNFQGVGGQNE